MGRFSHARSLIQVDEMITGMTLITPALGRLLLVHFPPRFSRLRLGSETNGDCCCSLHLSADENPSLFKWMRVRNNSAPTSARRNRFTQLGTICPGGARQSRGRGRDDLEVHGITRSTVTQVHRSYMGLTV